MSFILRYTLNVMYFVSNFSILYINLFLFLGSTTKDVNRRYHCTNSYDFIASHPPVILDNFTFRMDAYSRVGAYSRDALIRSIMVTQVQNYIGRWNLANLCTIILSKKWSKYFLYVKYFLKFCHISKKIGNFSK